MPGLGTEPRREPRDRVVVLPRLAVHDLNAVELFEQGGSGRVRGGGPGNRFPHFERFGRTLVPDLVGMPRLRRDPDDARRPRIGRGSPRLPHGRAFLREGLRALLGVLGAEDRARELRLLLER